MPRASKRPVNKNVLAEIQDNFSYLISSLSSSKDIQIFFTTFLTDEEKVMLTKRLMLHLMLNNQYEPIEIVNLLAVSQETVNKHKHMVSLANTDYKSIIGKISKRRKTQEFWKIINAILKRVDVALDTPSSGKARAKMMFNDYD